eukprot:15247102-Ditylum_brightwellii.AAC.1
MGAEAHKQPRKAHQDVPASKGADKKWFKQEHINKERKRNQWGINNPHVVPISHPIPPNTTTLTTMDPTVDPRERS